MSLGLDSLHTRFDHAANIWPVHRTEAGCVFRTAAGPRALWFAPREDVVGMWRACSLQIALFIYLRTFDQPPLNDLSCTLADL